MGALGLVCLPIEIGQQFLATRKMSDFPLLLASEIGVTRRTVTRWCAAGKVPGAYRTKGGHWRLRKPRRETCWGRYDDKIVEFVVRYTRVPGDPLSARQAAQLNKIALWLDRNKLIPAAASIIRRLVQGDNDTPPSFDWQFAEAMERLIDGKQFTNALEFSLVAEGISDDDKLPMGWENISIQERGRVIRQHFEDLKDRDPKKYDLLTQRDMLKMMKPRAYEATATRVGMLMIKAAKLRLNMREVTPENLANELRISQATLYRRYGQEAVRRACRPVPMCDELPTSVRYRLS
jgi:hypothetical protein